MDDRPTAASAPDASAPAATPDATPARDAAVEGPGLFALLEALALAAPALDAAGQSTPGVDDRPQPDDTR